MTADSLIPLSDRKVFWSREISPVKGAGKPFAGFGLRRRGLRGRGDPPGECSALSGLEAMTKRSVRRWRRNFVPCGLNG